MASSQASSKYFEQVAGRWDSIRAGYFTEGVRDAAIARAYLRPEMAVADIGAGTGFIAAGLAPLVKKVYAVDGSPAMLEVAQKNLAGFENIEIRQADGLALPFPGESLDAVFANMYLHHCEDPAASIREMVRVLRPGGRLVITDMDAHPHAWFKEEMADVWLGFERSQVNAWFKAAGLVNVVVACSGQSCAVDSQTVVEAEGRRATVSIFAAVGTRRMPMREQVQGAYAARAAGSCGCGDAAGNGGSCCSGTAEAPIPTQLGYSAAEIASAPAEAAEISLGCGNPTAIANLRPGEVVLDIGSGGGLDAFLAASRVGPSGRVIGVDMTPAMLQRARAAARRNHIPNVRFRWGYAEKLPVEDASVDVILSNCVINLAEDKGRVFEEAFRVLKPGGRLEVSDVLASGSFPAEIHGDAGAWSECVSGALPEREYLDLIEGAGFEAPSVRRSPALGDLAGTSVYSAIVSAVKPG